MTFPPGRGESLPAPSAPESIPPSYNVDEGKAFAGNTPTSKTTAKTKTKTKTITTAKPCVYTSPLLWGRDAPHTTPETPHITWPPRHVSRLLATQGRRNDWPPRSTNARRARGLHTAASFVLTSNKRFNTFFFFHIIFGGAFCTFDYCRR